MRNRRIKKHEIDTKMSENCIEKTSLNKCFLLYIFSVLTQQRLLMKKNFSIVTLIRKGAFMEVVKDINDFKHFIELNRYKL